MPAYEAGEQLSLVLSRDLSEAETMQLTQYLGTLGIFADQAADSFMNAPMLRDHIIKTLPNTPEDFLGKEHFWFFGLGARLGGVSNLFHSLTTPNDKENRAAVDPADYGLVVTTRLDAGLDPVPSRSRLPGGALLRNQPYFDLAIQSQGVLELAKTPRRASQLYQVGREAVKILGRVAQNLEHHLSDN